MVIQQRALEVVTGKPKTVCCKHENQELMNKEDDNEKKSIKEECIYKKRNTPTSNFRL